MVTTERLFFALLPNKAIIEQINLLINSTVPELQYNPAFKDVAIVSHENYHITLSFLGNVNTTLVPQIISYISKLKAPKFQLTVNTTGYFKKRKIFWLGIKKIPYELDFLLDAIEINLQRINELAYDSARKSYIPHITILKRLIEFSHLAKMQRKRFKIVWDIEQFFLVKSVNHGEGVKYETLATFNMS